MKFSEIQEQSLTELKREWSIPDLEDGYTLVSFRGRYWRLPSYNIEEAPEAVLNSVSYFTGVDVEDLADLNELAYERPDIIVGYVDSTNVMTMQRTTATRHPRSSIEMQKLAKELNLRGVTVSSYDSSDDGEAHSHYTTSELTSFPDSLYHGTSSSNLQQIIKMGLRPGMKTNWEGIEHTDLVFGTAEFGDATFHANKVSGAIAHGEDVYLTPEEDFPVVIEFKIPDKRLIVPDYDVAAQTIGYDSDDPTVQGYTYKHGYDMNMKSMVADQNPEGRVWKSAGIYGYKGRIPPSHITHVYTNFFNGALSTDPAYTMKLNDFNDELEAHVKDYYGDEDEDDGEYY